MHMLKVGLQKTCHSSHLSSVFLALQTFKCVQQTVGVWLLAGQDQAENTVAMFNDSLTSEALFTPRLTHSFQCLLPCFVRQKRNDLIVRPRCSVLSRQRWCRRPLLSCCFTGAMYTECLGAEHKWSSAVEQMEAELVIWNLGSLIVCILKHFVISKVRQTSERKFSCLIY